MENLPIVTVRGTAELEVPPELARVSVMVFVRARGREQAEARLVELSAAIGRVLDPMGDALRKHAASGVWVYPVLRSRRNTSPDRFEGRRSWTIEVTDFAVLPRLLADLVVGDEVTIGGPYWQLESDSEVYQQARLAAVKDAVKRATAYAEAFGASIDSLVEVSDTGLMGQGAPEMPMFARSAAPAGSMERSAIEEIDLEPVTQTVRGGIEARFTMTRPDLGALASN